MRALFVMLLVSMLFFGCAGEQPPQNETNVTPPPPPPVKNPSVTITSPANGGVVMVPEDTADVTLTMSTQNLVLRQPGGTAKAGEGHFRVTVDSGSPQTVTTKTYVMSGLSLGTHTVKVEVLNNDRTPYSPPVYKEISFELQKEQPAEYIPQHYTVNILDFSYEPANITVKVGDSITFINTGSYPRSATCFLSGAEVFDTDVLAKGQNATITFTEIMECEYYSTTHYAMKGHVKVESN